MQTMNHIISGVGTGGAGGARATPQYFILETSSILACSADRRNRGVYNVAPPPPPPPSKKKQQKTKKQKTNGIASYAYASSDLPE